MSSLAKRCSVAAILTLAALLPQFNTLKTSEEGLRLIADFEGCRLSPYQCSAGVWTNGIGHTAGVKPGAVINERQAAAHLIDDVRAVERGLARCMDVKMPQPVYDAVSAFAFNVGVNAACNSTLATFVKRRQWQAACDQLPRWIYVNGVKNKGLERRRTTERALCLSGISR